MELWRRPSTLQSLHTHASGHTLTHPAGNRTAQQELGHLAVTTAEEVSMHDHPAGWLTQV